MKKIFSLFAAVLMAGSMMADAVVFDGTENTSTGFTKGGVTVAFATDNYTWKGDAANISGFNGYWTGEANPKVDASTNYSIESTSAPTIGSVMHLTPASNGTMIVYVVVNSGKPIFVHEDNAPIKFTIGEDEYNPASTLTAKYYGAMSFPVTAGSTYSAFCTGSKMGFYGYELIADEAAGPVEGVLVFDAPDTASIAWNLPYATDKLVNNTASYTDGVNTIEVSAPSGGSAYYFNSLTGNVSNYWALFFGKSGAYVSTSLSYDVAKIKITGTASASASTIFKVYAGATEIGTHTGSKDEWEVIVPATSKAAGTIYKIQVTSAHNAQIAKIEFVEAVAGAPEAPVFGLEAGTYTGAQTVSLSCPTEDAEIHYTLDGTEPTAASALYAEALAISETTTVKAVAVKNGLTSTVVSATYAIIYLDGEGTQANPYTIADVKKLNNPGTTGVWVAGTIVGFYANNKPVAGTDGAAATNLAIATGNDTIPVALPTGAVRNALNLADNPANLGKNVKVKGELSTYFSTTGVKNVNDYELETVGAWDGTVTLSKESFSALSELEGLTLTFNGAATLALLDEEGSMIALQNEDGGEMYAIWAPAYGGTHTINGAVVTLSGWYAAEGETDALPSESATLYVEDYGSFIVDGDEEATFETAEIAFETAGPTTYTVTYTVNGFDAEHCLAQAGYFNDSEEGDSFVAGANTVPENMSAFVYVMTTDGYTVEVKVNGEVVTLADGYWDGAINADMTIDVTFTEPSEPNPWATVYTSNVTFIAGTNSYLTEKINIDGTEYDAFKIGTSKNTGNCTITLPAGTEHLYIHATGWSLSETTTMTVSGAGLNATETLAYYLGISNNSPYTVAAGRDASKAFFAFDFATPLAAETTVTLSGNARVVFFGVNVEGNFTPTALENVKAEKAVKMVENGKVVIIKNGVKYNVMGAKL